MKKKHTSHTPQESTLKSENTQPEINSENAKNADPSNAVPNQLDELDILKTQFEELNDKYLRCLAEYDNFRKRTQKEKDRIFTDAISYAVKGMTDILDNFERALKYDTENEEIKKGFEMIFNQLLDTLKKLGIEEINASDVPFDPNLHNAVMHIEDDQYGPNEIVEVLQKGYKIGDSIIRYAMVKVAN